jgi:hypothetical protein
MNDAEHQTCEGLVNSMYRELGFFDHHRADEQWDQAGDSLETLKHSLSMIERIFEALEKAPDCPKCGDTGVIVYGPGDRKLDCKCRESPIKEINDQGKTSE